MYKKGLTILLIAIATVIVLPTENASATFNKNRIIDDDVFSKKNSMSVKDINAFLNKFSNSCISTNSGFQAKEPTGYSYEAGFQFGNYVSAGQVIYSAAQAYDLNPQVLIVTLEKEQSLVTGRYNATFCDSPSGGFSRQHKYAAAMGYACTDNIETNNYSGVELYRRNGTIVTETGDTCVESKAKVGFSQQVIRAAWLLKFGQQRSLGNIDWAIVRGNWDNSDDLQSCYSGPMTEGNHQVCPSGSVIYYDGYRTIDGTKTYMGTGATAALYWYTPHFHGNELFVNIFENWFGSTYGVSITVEGYDLTTDKSGEEARVGIRLSKVPKSSVVVKVAVFSPSNGQIVDSNTVTIPPENWNKPTYNDIRIKGLDNSALEGSFENKVVVQKVSSKDRKFNNYPVSLIEIKKIAHLDNSSSPNVYRLYNSTLRQHLLTANKMKYEELIAGGEWRDDGIKFSYCYGGEQAVYRLKKGDERRLAVADSDQFKRFLVAGFEHEKADFAASAQGDIPVYWLYDSSVPRSLYSTNPNEGSSSGFVNQGVAFYTCSEGMEPVYQLRKPDSSFFYTKSNRERNRALYDINYIYQGLAFYTCPDGDKDVYRLYKGGTGTRFYTTSEAERDRAVNKIGYRYEGIGFRICSTSSRNVFRLYRGVDGLRYYTTSEYQRDKFNVKYNFRYEGTAFYSK